MKAKNKRTLGEVETLLRLDSISKGTTRLPLPRMSPEHHKKLVNRLAKARKAPQTIPEPILKTAVLASVKAKAAGLTFVATRVPVPVEKVKAVANGLIKNGSLICPKTDPKSFRDFSVTKKGEQDLQSTMKEKGIKAVVKALLGEGV